ncbi:MAG: hypothetical protein ACK5NF_07405 [Bacilli bacterium]
MKKYDVDSVKELIQLGAKHALKNGVTSVQTNDFVDDDSDAPIEDINPFECIHCAVNSNDLNNFLPQAFNEREKVDVKRAFQDYTVASA